MAKFLPDYRYDIFLSYAHVDDWVSNNPPGWVTTFRNRLEGRLVQLLGKRDAVEIWMDHDMNYADGVTDQIMRVLDDTAILLVVLSPGYAASEWCKKEKNKFLESAASRSGTQIMIVERERYEDDRDPTLELIPDRKKFEFWQRDETGRSRILGPPVRENQLYFDRIDDVSQELAKTLKRLRAQPRAQARVVDSGSGNGHRESESTVYLAHVTDDLENTRIAIVRRLEESNVRVLPHGHYSLDPAAFRKSAERDLARSQLFVQLLSQTPGKKPPDLPGGYAQLQCDLAKAANIPVMQWRSPDVDVDSIDDADHRTLIDSPTVRAEALEDFKRAVMQHGARPEPEIPAPSDSTEVFVCADSSDRALAEDIGAALKQLGAGFSLPTMSEDPGEYRQDLTRKLLSCDGLILAFGECAAELG